MASLDCICYESIIKYCFAPEHRCVCNFDSEACFSLKHGRTEQRCAVKNCHCKAILMKRKCVAKTHYCICFEIIFYQSLERPLVDTVCLGTKHCSCIFPQQCITCQLHAVDLKKVCIYTIKFI